MNKSFDREILRRKLSRRRALKASAAAAGAAALLAACGGSDDDGGGSSSGGSNQSGLIYKPAGTAGQAKVGGALKWFAPSEPRHFDIMQGLAPLNNLSNLTTDYMLNEKPNTLAPPEYSEVIADLATSWEWSPDRTTLTLKLRDGVKWHNKPPVNARAFDAEDVIFSWNRYSATSQGRANLANSVNPNAPVLSVTASDARTIVIKLKEPVVYLLSQLTPGQTGNFAIMPREADSGYDPRTNLIGNGPYTLENYQASVGMTFRRNPEYWDKASGGWAETIEYPTLPEYAQVLAQFKAGNIHTMTNGTNAVPRPEDVIVTKQDVPDAQILLVQAFGFNMGNTIQFGTQPTEANKAFKDERVRQALSMAIDRDAYIDAFYNVDVYAKQGLEVGTYWHTALGPAPGWRLDPKDTSKFGENAKYYQHNVDEAKKLLAAAGYGNGIEVLTSYIRGTELGADFQRTVEVRQQMLVEAGVKPTVNLIDYTSEYLPKYITAAGKFDGLVYRTGVAPGNDAVIWLNWRYKSGSGDGWIGFDAAGRGDGSGDPDVDRMIDKARGEVDVNARKAIVNDLQKHLAKKMYCISLPGQADTFDLAWPALSNYRYSNGDRRTPMFTTWVDETKAPINKPA
jgi:peptide/nickel transport system substrate-binding protein